MDLTRLLPHRPPMLLLDEVREIQPGRRLVGVMTVRADGLAPYLVLESWLQSAAVLVGLGGRQAGSVPLVGALRGVAFGRAALAGETVEHRVEIVKLVGRTAICTGAATAGTEPIVQVGHATVLVSD